MDINYFINKFESIPELQWSRKKFFQNNKSCAFGHLGCRKSVFDTEESTQLCNILGGYTEIVNFLDVNEGKTDYNYLGSTPKERCINYLKSIKK